MLYVRLQETLWPGFCYCLVVREQRPPLTVCLQSADNVHSLIKRCSQRGIYAVNNSQKPPLSIRRPTVITKSQGKKFNKHLFSDPVT